MSKQPWLGWFPGLLKNVRRAWEYFAIGVGNDVVAGGDRHQYFRCFHGIDERDQITADAAFPGFIDNRILPDGAFGRDQNSDDFRMITLLEPLDRFDDFRCVGIFHWLTVEFSIDALLLQIMFSKRAKSGFYVAGLAWAACKNSFSRLTFASLMGGGN